jgi:hypothetical protein
LYIYCVLECSNAPDMPVPLPAEVSCYLSNTCTGVDCCVQVDKLGLAINAYVLLDTCNNAFTIGIENYKHTTTILDIDYDQIHTFSMMGLVKIRYVYTCIKF